MKAYALYRKGYKETLLYSEHAEQLYTRQSESPHHQTSKNNPMIGYWRPLIFENRREIKAYLLLHGLLVGDHDVRRITIT